MALTDRDRRALTILGIVAGVAIVAFVLFNVLAGGGGGESAAPPTGTTGPTAPYSPTITPTPPRETLPPVYGERDPFSAPPGLATPSGSVGPTSTVSPTYSPSSSISPSSTASPRPGSSITIGGHRLTLLAIFASGEKAQVRVDETVWTLEDGSTFPNSGIYKLVGIRDQACARFTYRDTGFTLCL
jgi:hypothetical protein